jgi:hypothetical protein
MIHPCVNYFGFEGSCSERKEEGTRTQQEGQEEWRDEEKKAINK